MKQFSTVYKKIFTVTLSIFVLVMLMGSVAIGQDKYPSRPISWTVGYTAGGSADIAARAFAGATEKALKQTIVITNRPGAGSAIQLQALKISPADGYYLGSLNFGGFVQYHLQETPYNPYKDFTHLAQYGGFTFGVAVHPESPWKTLKELVEYAKQNPGKLKYGAFLPGSPATLVAESFAFHNGFKWTLVSYDGDVLAATSLVGKNIDAVVVTNIGWAPYAKAGKLRLLGVFLDNRSKDFPDVPTVKEQGFKYNGGFGTVSVLGPANLPTNVKETLFTAFRTASKDKEFLETMEKYSLPAVYREGDAWLKYIDETDKDAVTLMKQIGYKVIK